MSRARLSTRRAAMTLPVTYLDAGTLRAFSITIGGFEAGGIAEVFVNDGLGTGTALRHIASDAAVLASLALQHGATLTELDHSLSRDEQGRPGSIIAAVVDAMVREQRGGAA